jgi:hypothetical protein
MLAKFTSRSLNFWRSLNSSGSIINVYISCSSGSIINVIKLASINICRNLILLLWFLLEKTLHSEKTSIIQYPKVESILMITYHCYNWILYSCSVKCTIVSNAPTSSLRYEGIQYFLINNNFIYLNRKFINFITFIYLFLYYLFFIIFYNYLFILLFFMNKYINY